MVALLPLLTGHSPTLGPLSVPSGVTPTAVGERGSTFPASNTLWDLDPRVHTAVGKGGGASPSSRAFRTRKVHLVRRSSFMESRPTKTFST